MTGQDLAQQSEPRSSTPTPPNPSPVFAGGKKIVSHLCGRESEKAIGRNKSWSQEWLPDKIRSRWPGTND